MSDDPKNFPGNGEVVKYRAACPSCGVVYRVPENLRDVKFRCKKCQVGIIDTTKSTVATSAEKGTTVNSASVVGIVKTGNGGLQTSPPVERITNPETKSIFSNSTTKPARTTTETTMPDTLTPVGKNPSNSDNKTSEVKTEVVAKPPVNRLHSSEKSENLEYYSDSKPLANRIIGTETTLLPSVEMEQLRKLQKNDGLVEW